MPVRTKHTGGRVINNTLTVIFPVDGDTIFTREIWNTYGKPLIVILGEGWTVIHDFTFGDTDIQQIKIPESVKEIGKYAFDNTPKLESVVFNPDSQLTTIGEGAFNMASSLTSIEIPAGVKTIPFMAFSDASKLKSVTFLPNSQLHTIESNAFNNADLYSLKLPPKLEVIGGFVFSGNNNLHTIYLHPDVLARLNRDSLSVPLEFGTNNFDQDRNYSGIDHQVEIISSGVTTQGGRTRKLRSLKSLIKRKRKHITKRRGHQKRSRNRMTRRRKSTYRK